MIAAVILLNLAGIGVWASAQEKVLSRVDEQSGIMINTGTTEETVISYFELLRKGRYDAAVALQTQASRKSFNAAVLKYRESLVKMTGASLAKVFSARIEEGMALVGYIREVSFLGNSEASAVVGITLLKRNPSTGEWQIINDLKEIPPQGIPAFLKQMLELENSMAKTELASGELTPYQIKQVQGQVKSMQKLTKQNLQEYQELQRSKLNVKQSN